MEGENPLQEWFPDGKWKPFLLTTLVSIAGSFLISYPLNQRSLRSAEQALAPRLGIEETRFDQTNSYILGEQTQTGVLLKIRFKIRNNGGSYARDIRIAEIFARGEEYFSDRNPPEIHVSVIKGEVSPSGAFTLAPQESRLMEARFLMPVEDPRAVIDMIENIKINKLEVPFAMEIFYRDENETSCEKKIGLQATSTPAFVDFKYSVFETPPCYRKRGLLEIKT